MQLPTLGHSANKCRTRTFQHPHPAPPVPPARLPSRNGTSHQEVPWSPLCLCCLCTQTSLAILPAVLCSSSLVHSPIAPALVTLSYQGLRLIGE